MDKKEFIPLLRIKDILTIKSVVFVSMCLLILFSINNFDYNLLNNNNLLNHHRLLLRTDAGIKPNSLLFEITKQNELIIKQNQEIIDFNRNNKGCGQIDQLTSTSNSHDSLKTMKELGEKSGTDKVLHHGYERYYPIFLENLRMKPINVLEIGFLHGNSYKMWTEYFPNGNVYFMEKDNAVSNFEKKNARFHGDQSKIEDLNHLLNVKQIKNNLDLIIDDGSHFPEHQKISFKYLFINGLKPGGIYIVEDIEINYWLRGETYGNNANYGVGKDNSIIEYFKDTIDVINNQFQSKQNQKVSPFGIEIDKHIHSVFFGENCVIIIKKTLEQIKRKTNYRHSDKVELLTSDLTFLDTK